MPSKGVRVQRDPATPAAFEELAVTNAGAVSFATNFKNLGVLAGVLVENTGNIGVRYRFEGAPTTTSGHRLLPGQTDYWNEQEARNAQMISEGAATTVTMTAYRE